MSTLAFDVLWRDRGASKGLQGLGKDAEKTHGRLGALEKLGPKLGAAFAGLELAGVLHDSIGAASDLNETVSKSQVIFGASAGSIRQWAQGAATSMGLSEQAALESASSFGDLFLQLGVNRTKAVELSQSTVQLAADLGSFNNLDTADVLDRIAGAYRGEYDGLQKLIPNISDTRVKQEALTLSHKKSEAALTAQDKALAVNAILHKDGARAVGDFAKTAAGAANQQKIANAEFENAKAAIGNDLLPVWMTLLKVVREDGIPVIHAVADGLNGIPTGAYAAAAGLVGVYGAIRVGSKVVETAKMGHEALQVALNLVAVRSGQAAAAQTAQTAASGKQAVAADAAAVSTSRLGTAVGTLAAQATLAAGVAGLGYAFDQITAYEGASQVATVKTDELSASLLDFARTGKIAGASADLFNISGSRLWGTVDTGTEAVHRFRDEAVGAFSHDWTDVIGRLQTGGERVATFTKTAEELDAALAQMASNGHVNEATKLYLQFVDATGLQGEELEHVTNRFPALNAALAANAAATKGAAAQGRDEGDALRYVTGAAPGTARGLAGVDAAQKGVTKSAHDQHLAHQKVMDDLAALSDRTLSVRQRDRELRQAQDDLTASLKTNGRGMSLNSKAGRDNADALDSVAAKTRDALLAHRQAGEPLRTYRQRVNAARDALVDEARRAGMSKTAAERYAAAILAVPIKQVTTYSTPGARQARLAARDVKRALDAIGPRKVKVTLEGDGTLSFTQGNRKGRATGGRIDGWSPHSTADNIPVAATAGEHYWSVQEVRAAGGHSGVERLRAMARAGMLRDALHLATGGRVTAQFDTHLPSYGTVLGNVDALTARTFRAAAIDSASGGAGVARWLPMVRSALTIANQAQGYAGITLHRMNQESGGNPTIVNRWDSNWLAGTPSVGLMQVIGPTYRRFKHPQYDRGPYLYGTSVDPLANTLASMRYAIATYGSLPGAYGRQGGYDRGGLARGAGWLSKGPAPERMLSPAQTAIFERAMAMASAGGGGGAAPVFNITLNAPNYVGSRHEMLTWLNDAARSGHLDAIVANTTTGRRR